MRILSVADPVSTLGSLVVALLTLVSTQANGQALTQGALFTGTVGGADVQLIIVERGDYNGRVLSVRRDDLRAIASLLESDEPQALDRLSAWSAIVDN